MGLIERLFGKRLKASPDQGLSRLQAISREQTRRELMAMALRDTLKKHGLAAGSITPDALSGIVGGRQRGMHVQLVFKDWEPSLLSYVVALERAFKARLRLLDPLSQSWLLGVTWRFDPADPMSWPQFPGASERKMAGVAHSVTVRSRSTAPLEALLTKRDAAFRQKAAGHAEFSPTLPMSRS